MRKTIFWVYCAALLIGPVRASDLFEIGPQTIVAGGGLGDGGPALDASLLPSAVVAGPDGVLYIADEQHNVVRRVVADGTVETVVGNGSFGLDDEELPASESRLAVPAGLALSPAGQLYLVDLGNQQVRVVEPNGILRTVLNAQMPLLSTPPRTFFAPADIAFDDRGRLYVADRGNNTVWQIDPSGGGRPVAGDGQNGFSGDGQPSAQAHLGDPRAVVVGADYSIYIADTGNGRVRVVDPDGRIHTLIGDGGQEVWTGERRAALAASIRPVDLALDGRGQLLVLDALGSRLLRLEPGGDVSVVAQFETEAEPRSVSVDTDGRIVVALHGGRQVVKLDGQETVALAGNGRIRASGDGGSAHNASFFAPAGVVYDKDGNLYIAERSNHLVRRVRSDGTVETIAGTGRAGFSGDGGPGWQAQLRAPAALAFDGAGNLYIADSGNGRIRRLGADGRIETVAGSGAASPTVTGGLALETALEQPVALDVARNGDLLIADAGGHRVYRLTDQGLLRPLAGGGELSADGSTANEASLDRPQGVAADGAGGVYIADSGNSRLLHVDSGGILRVLAAAVGLPTQLVVGADGALIFAEAQQHQIGRLPLRQLWPVPQARVSSGANYTVETVAALRQEGLQEVVFDAADQLYLTYRTGVDRIGLGGERQAFAAFQPRAYATVPAPAFLGQGLLMGHPSRTEAHQALTLLWPDAEGKPLFHILPHLFGGSDALSAAGTLFLHQRDGRLLQLEQSGELADIATLEAGRAHLQAGPDGLLFVAVESSGVLYQGRDEDGNGTLSAVGELRRLATLPAAIVDLAYVDGLYIAAADRRIYRLGVDGQVEVFAAGFAPALLDITAGPQETLYVLEGDGRSGRILRLKPPAAVLVAWPPRLDFGALIVGQDAVHSLILSNEGNLPVHLRQQENPLVQILGADVVHLEPGESREFQVTIDNFVAGQTADAVVWRDVDSGAALLQMPVAVKGLAPVLHTGANELDFGLVEVGMRSKRTLRLRNEGDAALQVRQLEVEAPFAVILDGQRVLKPGAEAVLQVYSTPTQRLPFAGILAIHTNDSVRPVRRIALRGTAGQAELTQLADLYVLDAVEVGKIGRQYLEVNNGGDVPLRIDQVRTGTRRLLVKPQSLQVQPGESGILELTYRPLEHGEIEGEITFTSNDPAHSQVSLPFAGRGVSALLQLEATVHVFAATSLGEEAVWEMEIENFSRQRVAILQVETNNRQFRVLSRPNHLGPGEKGRVRLAYRPTRSGETRGVLTVATDLAEARQLEIDLRGRAPVPTTLRFATVPSERLVPGTEIRLPIWVEAAERLRGVALTVDLSGSDVEFVGIEFSEDGLLTGEMLPLVLVDRPRPGQVEVGISFTGGSVLEGINGSGILGIMRLRLGRATAVRREVVISRALLRSATGSVDVLERPAVAQLQLELVGDFDGDGRLALTDLFVLLERQGEMVTKGDEVVDLTGDGQVDRADIAAWYAFFRALPVMLDTP